MTNLTAFGKFSRKKRVMLGLAMKDVAEKLEVSSGYLSAVELGKTNPPLKWVEQLTEIYQLDDVGVKKLREAMMRSTYSVKIELVDRPKEVKELAILFAKRVHELTDDECAKLIELLEEKNDV